MILRLSVILTILGAAAWAGVRHGDLEGPRYRWSGKAFGVCWEGAPRAIGESEVEALASLGPNSMSQTPFGWMESPTKPDLRFGKGGWWGESEAGVRETARLARSRQIATLLKPHIWIHNSWPGDVVMSSEEDWKTWFEGYRKFALHWAEFARDEKLEGYCIGTELDKTVGREKEWRALIAEIRAIYPGLLTYAANWTDYDKVPFWDALDAIGVNAYFPLSEKPCPTADELTEAWKPIAGKLKSLAETHRIPVVLTEIGYHSVCGAYSKPWEWRMRDAKPHFEDQAAGYEAVARTFFHEPWFGGVFWWKWHARRKVNTANAGDTEFTPQGKPAMAVMERHYKAASQPAK